MAFSPSIHGSFEDFIGGLQAGTTNPGNRMHNIEHVDIFLLSSGRKGE